VLLAQEVVQDLKTFSSLPFGRMNVRKWSMATGSAIRQVKLRIAVQGMRVDVHVDRPAPMPHLHGHVLPEARFGGGRRCATTPLKRTPRTGGARSSGDRPR
jgi:hypothetical protein